MATTTPSQSTSIAHISPISRSVTSSSPPAIGLVQTYEPEDVLSDSLQTLYNFLPVTFASAGASYTYTHPESSLSSPIEITLQTPDTDAANWSLHASSIWIASVQLASGVDFLRIDQHLKRTEAGSDGSTARASRSRPLKILELGASAGLPSILIAKIFPEIVSVVASDYPDPHIIKTLTQNIRNNNVDTNCHAMSYDWGSDPSPLFSMDKVDEQDAGFDIIMAADTLWNSEYHSKFVDALQRTLRKGPNSRVHLVAGLHTGRYTLDSFLRLVVRAGFCIIEVVERRVESGPEEGCVSAVQTRAWDVTRAEHEEENDRRRWVIWIEICWKRAACCKHI
ncbi:hypothetical protein Ac2012v2_003147 [Leucoagaricus gongylophorus]